MSCFYYRKGKSAYIPGKNCAMCTERMLTSAKIGLQKFVPAILILMMHYVWEGRSNVDENKIKTFTDVNRRRITREIAKRLNLWNSTAHNHLKYTILRSFLTYTVNKLDKLNDSLKQKRPGLVNRKGIMFHHDNVRPHTSLATCQNFLQLVWNATASTVFPPSGTLRLPLISVPTRFLRWQNFYVKWRCKDA